MTNPNTLKDYPGEEEWENFQPTDTLSPDISGKLWNNINKNTGSPAARRSLYQWAAVAASVLLVLGLWLFISRQEKGAGAASVAATQHISNTTADKKVLTLSDGSTVGLSAHSTLSYAGDFNSLKRSVILNGEASFDIAKDAVKPFSVYNNSILITVLGTRFTVSPEADSTTKVVLQEGRIMVKITDPSFKDAKKEYYLSPGDIFLFKKAASSAARVLPLEKDKEDSYVFNNYPLDVVFDQLQIIYNAKITYNKAGLGNRSFIGKVNQKDSLNHILQSIALLTGLHLHQAGAVFILS